MKILLKRRKPGNLVRNSIRLELHEYEAVQILLHHFCDIELIQKSNIYGLRTPDMYIDGVPWELKSLRGTGKYVIVNLIQKAIRQSGNVIVDLRYSKIPEDKCIRELEKLFSERKQLKRLLVITKSKNVIDICA